MFSDISYKYFSGSGFGCSIMQASSFVVWNSNAGNRHLQAVIYAYDSKFLLAFLIYSKFGALQNDLEEFFAMVNFTNPGILGDAAYFRRYYEVSCCFIFETLFIDGKLEIHQLTY